MDRNRLIPHGDDVLRTYGYINQEPELIETPYWVYREPARPRLQIEPFRINGLLLREPEFHGTYRSSPHRSEERGDGWMGIAAAFVLFLATL